MIEARSLSKSFSVHVKEPGLRGSVRSLFRRQSVLKEAVRGVSFGVAEGEIVGLIGANGAGKTTLTKMLAGIVHPTSGEASVLGHTPWERRDAFRRQVALIMGQKAQLWWDLPAADSFLLLKEIYQLDARIYAERLEELSGMLGVDDLMKVQLRRLSLGERMKMELIAALLHAPRAVFLDEPTIGLDLTAQRAIRDFLLTYRERHRPAMLLTSHYMEDIERLCERILILRAGELVYDGSLEQVVQTHAPEKLVTAHLERKERRTPELNLDALGEVVSLDVDALRIRVRRDDVPSAATQILAHFPVRDLQIEEDDIGSIIERILRSRGQATA